MIGGTIARLAVDHGHEVVLSNSRGPDTLADLVTTLGPRATAADPSAAAAMGELVVVTIPLKHYRSVVQTWCDFARGSSGSRASSAITDRPLRSTPPRRRSSSMIDSPGRTSLVSGLQGSGSVATLKQ
jgi:hypothetical protein